VTNIDLLTKPEDLETTKMKLLKIINPKEDFKGQIHTSCINFSQESITQ